MNVLPNKSLGQHWLHDTASLDAIVSAAALQPKDLVVEIGPGLGTLTAQILQTGAQVKAIEYDHQLAAGLAERLEHPERLEVVEADILRFRFDLMPAGYKIVANIPYYLTSHLLRLLTKTDNRPQQAVLLVQKEVAERVCASPGNMSLLSVAVQSYYDTSLGEVVPAALFTPPPKVDSQVLILQRLDQPRLSNASLFFQVVRAGFSERRKKLRSSLSGGLRIEKAAADQLLVAAGLPADARAQELSIDQWQRLADSYVSRFSAKL